MFKKNEHFNTPPLPWLSVRAALLYFGFKSYDYWHPDYKIPDSFEDPRTYYLDFSSKANYSGPFDEQDIFLWQAEDGQLHHSVIHGAQYVLGNYELYLQGKNSQGKEILLQYAGWLKKTQTTLKETKGVFYCTYPNRLYHLAPPWASVLAQSQAISILVRAFLETGEKDWLRIASLAFEAYKNPISKGGIISFENKSIFLEEYPSQPPAHVLNGFIFGIFGLYDLVRNSCCPEAVEIYHQAIESLSKNLYHWDTGYFSRYDLYPNHYNIASLFYHELHIKMLKVLYKITNQEKFYSYAVKFENYQKNRINLIRAFLKKAIFKLSRLK